MFSPNAFYYWRFWVLGRFFVFIRIFNQFTARHFSFLSVFSSETLLGVLAIYDIMLIDLLNMFLSLPGNLLYFVPTFKPYFSQVFIRDWFGKTHVFRLL